MKDITLLSHLKALTPTPAAGAVQQAPASGFAEAFKNAVEQVNEAQKGADQAIQKVATGESHNLHETMIALEKADISLRTMVQVRNKVIDAYQEIMRMQV